ncbi:unnamed protein product [Amoebophrya sp. A25]|nr:unnamed protein product [Amoebophrya sp. A25]|eukprot:GSA25T00014881001.1
MLQKTGSITCPLCRTECFPILSPKEQIAALDKHLEISGRKQSSLPRFLRGTNREELISRGIKEGGMAAAMLNQFTDLLCHAIQGRLPMTEADTKWLADRVRLFADSAGAAGEKEKNFQEWFAMLIKERFAPWMKKEFLNILTGDKEVWQGRVDAVAACTYRTVTAELYEKYLVQNGLAKGDEGQKLRNLILDWYCDDLEVEEEEDQVGEEEQVFSRGRPLLKGAKKMATLMAKTVLDVSPLLFRFVALLPVFVVHYQMTTPDPDTGVSLTRATFEQCSRCILSRDTALTLPSWLGPEYIVTMASIIFCLWSTEDLSSKGPKTVATRFGGRVRELMFSLVAGCLIPEFLVLLHFCAPE